jgi:hypothetical protein
VMFNPSPARLGGGGPALAGSCGVSGVTGASGAVEPFAVRADAWRLWLLGMSVF